MTWFRNHRRTGSWLALLALTLQLVLAFGHVHLDAGTATTSIAVAATTADTGGKFPNNGAKHDDDYCAICAMLTMLSGAQTAAAPAVLLPVQVAAADPGFAVEALRVAAAYTAFRSRAPPVS